LRIYDPRKLDIPMKIRPQLQFPAASANDRAALASLADHFVTAASQGQPEGAKREMGDHQICEAFESCRGAQRPGRGFLRAARGQPPIGIAVLRIWSHTKLTSPCFSPARPKHRARSPALFANWVRVVLAVACLFGCARSPRGEQMCAYVA
jgi:hypothetical protein